MFRWREAFELGIEEVDKEHRKLFEIGGLLYDLSSNKNDTDKYDEIMRVIEELKDYTIIHFNHEEQLMLLHSYENYEAHKFEHDFFVKKLQRIERKDIEGAQNDAIVEMLSFVADWITSHILKTDKEYIEFFKSKGL